MAISAGTIITRARYRTDKVNSTFIDDTNDCVPWADKGHRELYDLLVNAYGDDYFHAIQDFRVTSGTQVTRLNSIFDCTTGVAIDGGIVPYKICRLDVAFDGIRIPMGKWAWSDRTIDTNTSSWVAGSRIQYKFAENSFWWQPVPGATHCVRLYYIPRPTELTATGTNIHEQCEPWSEYIELYVAICIRQKERDSEQVAALSAQFAALKQHIIETAPPKDIGQPQPIVDLRSLEEGDDWSCC